MSVAQLPLWKRWWPIIDCVLTLQNQCRYVSKKLFVCYHFLLYNFLIFPMWSSLTCLKVHFLLFQQERSPVFRPHSFLSTCKDRVVPNMMCLLFKEVNHGNHFSFYPFALLFPGSTQAAAIFISTFFAPDFWFPFILLLILFSVVRSHMLLSPFSRITSFIFIWLRCVLRRLSATMNFLRCHIYFSPSNVFAGTLQLPSQGSADLILDAFTEFWDGYNLCPMTPHERQDLARSPPPPLP